MFIASFANLEIYGETQLFQQVDFESDSIFFSFRASSFRAPLHPEKFCVRLRCFCREQED